MNPKRHLRERWTSWDTVQSRIHPKGTSARVPPGTPPYLWSLQGAAMPAAGGVTGGVSTVAGSARDAIRQAILHG